MKPTRSIRTLPLDPQICADLVASEVWASRISQLEDGCIEWIGSKNSKGYGCVSVNTRSLLAHRVAYVASKRRDIRAGLVLDHLCRNRACVNPDHLEEVSQRVNVLRGTAPAARQSAQTTCAVGHELKRRDSPSARFRYCQTCTNARAVERRRIFREARKILGLTRIEYFEIHGQRIATAAAIIAAKENA